MSSGQYIIIWYGVFFSVSDLIVSNEFLEGAGEFGFVEVGFYGGEVFEEGCFLVEAVYGFETEDEEVLDVYGGGAFGLEVLEGV